MPAERPTRRSTGKPGPGSDDIAAPRPKTGPAPKARYIDVDPWAMFAELMETPEESPVERVRPKKK